MSLGAVLLVDIIRNVYPVGREWLVENGGV